jgi:hypothetical protein
MFVMAVSTWDDLREQYSEWRDTQVEKKRKSEAAHNRERALFGNRPRQCACGSKHLHQDSNGDIWCKECRSYYTFNNATLSYDFTDMRERWDKGQQGFDFFRRLSEYKTGIQTADVSHLTQVLGMNISTHQVIQNSG